MDYWDPSVVYQMVAEQHRERVARGEAALRLETALGAGGVRVRLAKTLASLAHHLDPARFPALSERAVRMPHASA